MALTDQEAAQVAAEEALRAAGVHADHLDRAVLMLDVKPGDSLRYTIGEAGALVEEMSWLRQPPGADPQRPADGKSVERGRAKAVELGWVPPPAGAAVPTGTSLQRRGREKAAQLGWTRDKQTS